MKKQTKFEKKMARLQQIAVLYKQTEGQLEKATTSAQRFDLTHRLNHLRREFVKAQEAN